MALINSSTDIANLAMSHLGQAPINNLTNPESKPEKIISLWYDQTRRSVLQMYDWNFAIKRKRLNKLAAAPEFGYEAQFALPSDYLLLLTVGDRYFDWHQHYTIEGQNLLSRRLYGTSYDASSESLPIRYICNYENVAGMSDLFIQAFSLVLAANVCYPITNNGSRLQQLNQDFLSTIKMAKIADTKSSPVQRVNRFRSYLEHQGRGDRLFGREFGQRLWRE